MNVKSDRPAYKQATVPPVALPRVSERRHTHAFPHRRYAGRMGVGFLQWKTMIHSAIARFEPLLGRILGGVSSAHRLVCVQDSRSNQEPKIPPKRNHIKTWYLSEVQLPVAQLSLLRPPVGLPICPECHHISAHGYTLHSALVPIDGCNYLLFFHI